MSHPIRAGLIQICDRFGDQYYLPYAIGLLQAYAQAHLVDPGRIVFGTPLYRRIRPNEAVKHLEGSDIILFSIYLWNHRLSQEIARRYRELHPEAVIVFGGPQVPWNTQRLVSFMEENPFLDLACFGEGEESFLRILEHFDDRDWDKVPGVAFRKNGEIVVNSCVPSLENLNLIPSPYLSGVFAPLLQLHPEGYWSALMESNRGCPFSCAFCYWGAGERRRVRTYSIERIFDEIDWFSEHQIEFLFCCDANFGLLERDMDIVERVADNKARTGFPRAFSVQNTKNSTAKIFALHKRMNDAGLQKGVNLALQSLNMPTLKAIARSNITTEFYSELLTLFNSAGIPAFSDLILGLPEETYDCFADGVEQIIRQGQHTRIQFINLTILENTAMVDPAYIDKYDLRFVESRIVSHHTSLSEESGILETQRLVVGTAAMPSDDWVRARLFSWVVSLFYFDHLLQIPFFLLDRLGGIGIREISERFMAQHQDFPMLKDMITFMEKRALEIQHGEPEYEPIPEYLNVWWPIDEYLLIHLVKEGNLDRFFAEAVCILSPYASHLPKGLIEDSLKLNRLLIKEPFISEDMEIVLNYPVPEIYAALLRGEEPMPMKGNFRYRIDRTSLYWASWDSWMREMVWYGSKRGDYLYPCNRIT